jgi:hypothetical protein
VFAVETFRTRKSASGTSGDETRDSIAKKPTMSAAEAPSRPSVRADVHPHWFPLTMAYTASISDAVTATAPATSRRLETGGRCALGRSRSESAKTATPIGTFTRKIQCHVSRSVSTPPRSTPSEPPPEATNPKTPIAFVRSAVPVNSVMISESETAETIAPPKPWIARAPTRNACEVASPHASEASVNSVIPARNSLRCPKRSPSRPPRSRKPPNVKR